MSDFRRMLMANANSCLVTKVTIHQGKTTSANTVEVEDRSCIEWIRENSHRYLGKFKEGVMNLCQLNDANGTQYFDGTTASERTTVGVDTFMMLPDFWYYCDSYGMAVDATYDSTITENKTKTNDIIIYLSNKAKKGYQKWDSSWLFGCYEAYAESNKLYSVSGKDSTGSVSQATFKTYARARGTGFHIVTWEQSCIMALLYYAYYGNVDCQAQCGSGTNDCTKKTGLRDSLGMADTTSSNGNSSSIVFWGLDNWWGNKYEWVDNVRFNVSGIDYIYHIDDPLTGTEKRSFRSYVSTSATGNCVSMYWGKNLDLAQSDVTNGDGNYKTGYCDFVRSYKETTARVAYRSDYGSYALGGVGYSSVINGSSGTSTSYGSRLAFRGEIRKAESVSVFKAL